MAATVIVPTRLTAAGLAALVEASSDASNGNAVRNVPGLHLILHNTDSGSHNVTFTTPATVGGVAVADPVVAVGAGATLHFANFDPVAYGDYVTFATGNALVKVTVYQAA